MKLSNLLLATSAMACERPTSNPAYDLENFVTSEDVQFELLMDNGKKFLLRKPIKFWVTSMLVTDVGDEMC